MDITYRKYLAEALEQAKQGLREGGIPIGAVLVREGEIIARGRNRRVQDGDPVAHAEIVCLRNAGRIGSFRGLTLVSTLMPCYLCSGAAVQFGIGRVVIGESRNAVSDRSWMEGHGIDIVDLEDAECTSMMTTWVREHPDLWREDVGA